MKTIDDDIKTGKFKSVYLLYGDEDYLKQQYKNKLKHALIKPDDTMNFARYEGDGIYPLELLDLAETLPFFADRRLILVEDSGFFKNGCEELAAYLPQMPPSACMVFVESEVDKRGKMYKAVNRIGSAVEFGEQKEQILTIWILRRLKKENKKITEPVLQRFLSKTGTDMSRIDSELEKLFCYTLGRETIEAADVEAVCTQQVENRIFEMINAIGRRDKKQALALYYDLLALKEKPMRILYLLSRQFRILLDVKCMKHDGVNEKTMAEIAGIPSFAVRRTLEQAAKFSREELKEALEESVQLEMDSKTGKLKDRLAVELLIMREKTTW